MNGRDERRLNVRGEGEGQPIEVVVDEVEFARTRQRVRDVQRLPDAAVHRGILAYPVAQTPSRVAVVAESSVANSVTSTPRATIPSASRLVTCSQGP